MADDMKCFDCGFINEGEKFCLNCGSDLKSKTMMTEYSLMSKEPAIKGRDLSYACNSEERFEIRKTTLKIPYETFKDTIENSSNVVSSEKYRGRNILIDKPVTDVRESSDSDYHVLHTPPLLIFIRIFSRISFVTLFVILALSLITIPVGIISLNYVQGGTISERLLMYLIFISVLITLAALGAIGNKFNSKINIHNLIEGLSFQILLVILALCLIIICGCSMSFIYAINSPTIIGFSVFLILIFGVIGFYILLLLLKKCFQRRG